MNLFVYGTLRRGGGLYTVKMTGFKYLGLYKTEPFYNLWDCGCPCLAWNGTTSVTGELYNMSWYDRNFVDIFNMEAAAGYKFEPVDVINFKYPTEPPYAFFQTPSENMYQVLIPGGDWIEHKNKSTPLLHP